MESTQIYAYISTDTKFFNGINGDFEIFDAFDTTYNKWNIPIKKSLTIHFQSSFFHQFTFNKWTVHTYYSERSFLFIYIFYFFYYEI